MQKINIAKFIFIAFIIPLFLTGCYDRFELDNLAYVIAIGADKGESGELSISYQIAIPLKITGEDSTSGKETYTTYTVSAPSLSIANSKVNSQISKELNLSHVKLIVYSEDVAKSDLRGHINSLISHINIRPRTTVAICKGTAKDFLNNTSPKLEANPARYYELLFSSHNYTNLTAGSELIDFYIGTQSLDREAFATYVELEEESENEEGKESKLSGLAVFRGTNMVGILNQELILPHLILTNDLDKSGYAVSDFNNPNRVISVTLDQIIAPEIYITLSGDTPHIQCNIELEAHLVSVGSIINFYENDNKGKLKDILEDSLKNDISKYLDLTIHEFKSDIAGLGRFAKSNFKIWKDFEDYKWLDKYPNSTYDLSIFVNLNVAQIISHYIADTEAPE